MIYRLATIDDAGRLAELCWEHQAEFDSLNSLDRDEFISISTEHLKRRLGIDLHCWVADDNEIVAHMFIYIIQKMPMPNRIKACWGRVATVRTIPEYRNKGVGSILMEYVKTWSKELDLQELIVYPSEQSIPFYERAGFSNENEVFELLPDSNE